LQLIPEASNINQNQFDALVCFAYNVGLGALHGSTLLKKVNTGDFDGAADEFLKWNHAGGVVVPGLTRRRQAERSLFLQPILDTSSNPSDQEVADKLGVDKNNINDVLNNRFGVIEKNGRDFTYQQARDGYVVDDEKTLAMNRALRGGREPSQKAQMTDWAIKQVTVQQPTVVTRDALLTPQQHEALQVGSTYTDKAFQSTVIGEGGSGYASIRQADYPGTNVVINDITLPPGLNVGPFAYGEVVLPRNTTIEITDRQVRADGAIMLKSRVVLPKGA
jgi:hypothetical protein